MALCIMRESSTSSLSRECLEHRIPGGTYLYNPSEIDLSRESLSLHRHRGMNCFVMSFSHEGRCAIVSFPDSFLTSVNLDDLYPAEFPFEWSDESGPLPGWEVGRITAPFSDKELQEILQERERR